MNYQKFSFSNYYLDFLLIFTYNTMSLVQSGSLESQLSENVLLVKICYIVMEISRETGI